MKSLSESLLSGKVSVDIGSAIKDVLGVDKEAAVDFEVKDGTLLVRPGEPARRMGWSARKPVLTLNIKQIKYLASLKIKRIESSDPIFINMPPQNFIKDLGLHHRLSEVHIINGSLKPVVMDGWNIISGQLSIEAHRFPVSVRNSVIVNTNPADTIFSVRLMDIMDIEWTGNRVQGKQSLCISTPSTAEGFMNRLEQAGLNMDKPMSMPVIMDLDMDRVIVGSNDWGSIRCLPGVHMVDFTRQGSKWKVHYKY